MFGFDAYAYWSIDLDHLYGAAAGNTSDLGAFRYTPAIGQLFAAERSVGELRYSLWTGDLGLAIYLVDCIRGDARFPTLDTF